MEEKKIIEGNKLIADFMGLKIGVESYSWRPGCTEPLQERHLNYHASWGWLIPVVEKIEEIEDDKYGRFAVHIYSNGCSIQSTQTDFRHKLPLYISDPNAILNTKLESTWYNVVDFIKWRNSQHKQTLK